MIRAPSSGTSERRSSGAPKYGASALGDCADEFEELGGAQVHVGAAVTRPPPREPRGD
jgi:hypothetical protein